MDELQNRAKAATSLLRGGLVAGDQDTITVFGLDQQNELRECTRKLSALMRGSQAEACDTIGKAISEMDRFEKKAGKRLRLFARKNARESDPEQLCERIEHATCQLEMQQAQIAKEREILKRVDASLQRCESELDERIEEGRRMLADRPSDSPDSMLANATDGSNEKIWYARLGKRVDELAVSQVVALQSRAQIKMLQENNLAAFDRISSFVFNLAAICRSQLTGKVGNDLYEARLEACASALGCVGERAGMGLDKTS